jgi:hypothetical protein
LISRRTGSVSAATTATTQQLTSTPYQYQESNKNCGADVGDNECGASVGVSKDDGEWRG